MGTSHTSLPGVDSDPDQYDGHTADPESEYYEADLLAPMGSCKALYPFEGECLEEVFFLIWDYQMKERAMQNALISKFSRR